MGVGTPWDILECISLGVDMFDCVMPTRNGRNAMLFTTQGVINIDNKKWEFDFSPLDDGIPCQSAIIITNHISGTSSNPKRYWGLPSPVSITWHFTSGWSGKPGSISLQVILLPGKTTLPRY